VLYDVCFVLSLGKGKSPDADSGMAVNSTEDEQLQELGKPRLGDIIKIRVNIKESQEFKVILVSSCLFNPIQRSRNYCSNW